MIRHAWHRPLLVASGAQLLACLAHPEVLPGDGLGAPWWAIPWLLSVYLLGIVVIASGLVIGPRTRAVATWIGRAVVAAMYASAIVAGVVNGNGWWLALALVFCTPALSLFVHLIATRGDLGRGLGWTGALQIVLFGLLVLSDDGDAHACLALLAAFGTAIGGWRMARFAPPRLTTARVHHVHRVLHHGARVDA